MRLPSLPRPVVRKLVIVLFGIYILWGVILCCATFIPDRQGAQDYQATLEAWRDRIIPDQATDVRFATRPIFQDTRVRLRFTISSSNLQDFIEEVCPNMEITGGGFIGLYNVEDIEWWRPEDAQSYSIGNCVENGTEMYRFLIDTTDPDSFLIYLQE